MENNAYEETSRNLPWEAPALIVIHFYIQKKNLKVKKKKKKKNKETKETQKPITKLTQFLVLACLSRFPCHAQPMLKDRI